MTLMMPIHAPHEATASEKEVFELIRDANESTEYVCLHSLGIARHKRKDYAETDFVLIGPLGIFCLEVKGGLISRNKGLWQIGWPGKTYSSAVAIVLTTSGLSLTIKVSIVMSNRPVLRLFLRKLENAGCVR
jgi:hypothetical protein